MVEAQRTVRQQVVAHWGVERLLHVWDRGLASAAWLDYALDQHWHFVVRWKKGNPLRPADAPAGGKANVTVSEQEHDGKAAWKLTAGLRA